jgi:hypothetical protein
MVAEVEEITVLVVTENEALVVPSATVTLAGTVAAALLLDSVTTAPPEGAGLLRVTDPVEEIPPVTLIGFTDTADSTDPADPSTRISARPIAEPVPVPTVNWTQATVFEGNPTSNPPPALGKAPTGTVLPSLKESVPDVMFSPMLGLS